MNLLMVIPLRTLSLNADKLSSLFDLTESRFNLKVSNAVITCAWAVSPEL